MNKQEMVGLIERCGAVVDGELKLLTRWRNSGAMSAARKAMCRETILTISSGVESPTKIAEKALKNARATADQDVLHPPSTESNNTAQELEDDLVERKGWNGPSLDDVAFEDALGRAEDNADEAATLAQDVLKECTEE